MSNKITYTNKVDLNVASNIADINKVTASDMNEIKTVVNNIDDASTIIENDITNIINQVNNPTYTTTEGTDLSINNTRVGKMKFEYYGDTEQENYNSQNLFDKNNPNILNNCVTGSGLTLDSLEGCKTLYVPCKPNLTYTITKIASTRFIVVTTTNTPAIGVSTSARSIDLTGTSITITAGATANYICVFYYYSGADTLPEQDILNSIQIKIDTPLPNPDYPIEVQTVTGENEIQICGENLFDVENAYHGTINASGVVGSNEDYRTTSFLVSQPSQSFYISSTQKEGQTSKQIYFAYYDQNKIFISRDSYNLLESAFTTPNNCYFVRVGVYTKGQENIMLVRGNTSKPYKAYNGNTFELNLGKNLLINNNGNIATNGLTFIKNQDGSITINGTATADTHYYMGLGNNSLKQRIDKEKVYSISIGQNFPFSAFFRISDFNNSGLFKQCQNAYGTNTNKVENIAGSYFESGQILAQIFVYNGQTANNFTIYPQLEASPVATSYSQPNKPLELCKIGAFQDYIYNNGGRWFKHKEIEKLIVNDISSFNVSQIGTSNYYRFQAPLDNARNDTTLGDTLTTFSNYFKPCTFNDRNTDYNNTVFQISNGLTTGLGIAFNTNVATTSSDFKTWLNTHNVVAYYIAKEFTEEEIIDETTLDCLNNIKYGAESYYDQTNITTITDNVQPILEVKALEKIS